VRRGRIDYRMRRIAALRDVREGTVSADDVCDAHPDLLRAARHLGTITDEPCPLCDDRELVHVNYVFERKGARTPGGRAVPRDALAEQAERFGELSVYVVEVCLGCHWHHLVESFLQDTEDTGASHG
jgi:hypothetical protein